VGSEARHGETKRAFDAVAPDYDGPRGNNALIQSMRAELHRALESACPPPARILDLGCGTGIDLAHFAARGYRADGIDQSSGMIAKSRARMGDGASLRELPLQDLERLEGRAIYDAIYSDLGPMNCVPDLRPVARAVERLLVPGGVFVGSIIGRYCPWELGWYGLRGRARRVAVRFARGGVRVPLGDGAVWTWYYTPAEVARAFAGFRLRSLRALHLFLPPPYLDAWAAAHPRATEALARLDARFAGAPVLRSMGDSFLIVLERPSTP